MVNELGFTRLPSLRRRLLVFLIVPMFILLVLDALITYSMALNYSNRVHDSDLADGVLTLAQMLRTQHIDSSGLNNQARFLIEYAPNGRNYFSVTSKLHGVIGSNGDFPKPRSPPVGSAPMLYHSHFARHRLRAAAYTVYSPDDPSDTLTVNIAETLQDRHQRAREILFMAVPMELLLIVCSLSLVWFGVSYGLRILHPLTQRLAERQHGLNPITDRDVPQEILPLTRTIDALFARLRGAMSLQERFIADAAHQLRTPLTGLRLHVERAQTADDETARAYALNHIRQLTQRAARTSSQLLALTRAQSPLSAPDTYARLDLTQLIPNAVTLRVAEALRAGIDLGYQELGGPALILGDAYSIQELMDNLIDNALRYAGRGASVTVSLSKDENGVNLRVEDNGPGVPPDQMARLGERFFRAPGTAPPGTGLGLAIVKQIASRHDASVHYAEGSQGGLSVTVSFPALSPEWLAAESPEKTRL